MNIERLYQSLLSKLITWVDNIGGMLPNITLAVIVVLLFWGFARLGYALSERALKRLDVNRAAARLLSIFLRVSILLTGAVIALGILKLDKALASVLAGAGIVGLALGFAFQDLATNVISGVGLAMNPELPFKIGDIIETNGLMGTVREVSLRTTTLESLTGQLVIIPNKNVYQETVVNYSATGRRRVDVPVGISYGENLANVSKVVLGALAAIRDRDPEREVEFYFQGFGDSSINFVARMWIDYRHQTDWLLARSQMVTEIKKAFNEHDIVIPFPIRTLDFGIRGGERLSDALRDAKVE